MVRFYRSNFDFIVNFISDIMSVLMNRLVLSNCMTLVIATLIILMIHAPVAHIVGFFVFQRTWRKSNIKSYNLENVLTNSSVWKLTLQSYQLSVLFFKWPPWNFTISFSLKLPNTLEFFHSISQKKLSAASHWCYFFLLMWKISGRKSDLPIMMCVGNHFFRMII